MNGIENYNILKFGSANKLTGIYAVRILNPNRVLCLFIKAAVKR